MNIDIRLSLGFFDHPKTKKLKKRLGYEGVESLLRLWMWSANNRPMGQLKGVDTESLELAANWDGDEGAFCSTLKTLGWLDGEEGAYSLHGWEEHQQWVMGSDARSAKAKKAVEKRWEKAKHNTENTTSIPQVCTENTTSILNDTHSNTPKTNNQEPIYTPLPPSRGSEYPEDFETIWSAYPKHKSKGAAFKAYQKAKKAGILPDDLLERIQTEAQCADWTKDNGQYVPHMSTWLNQHGWEDDDAQPAPVWVDPHREHHLIMNEIAEKYGPWGPRYYDGETDEDYNIREEKMIAEAVKRGVPEDYARGDSHD